MNLSQPPTLLSEVFWLQIPKNPMDKEAGDQGSGPKSFQGKAGSREHPHSFPYGIFMDLRESQPKFKVEKAI